MIARHVRLALACSVMLGCAASEKRAAEPMQQRQVESQPGAAQSDIAPSELSPASGNDTLQMNAAQADFDAQLADLERLDCKSACRALGSLERSAANVCGMAGEKSSICQDVQRRREDARGRVRERCGPCP